MSALPEPVAPFQGTGRFPLAQAMLRAALDCVVIIDAHGTVVHVNRAAEETFGWSYDEAVGREMSELIIPPRHRDEHRAGMRRYLQGGDPRVLGRRIEIEAIRRDGTEFPVELTITRADLNDHGGLVFVGYLRDISDRIAAEQELRDSRARIVAASYESRRQVERDLHDGAQQHLVGLALTLRLARARVAAGEADEALALLDEAAGDLQQATEELRSLARGIHPAVLTQGGLGPALGSLTQRAEVSTELQTGDLEDGRCSAVVEATAYFVVAEALTNVDRHAGAARAWITASGGPSSGTLAVEVRDDGRGGAALDAGSGIRGLADRVGALGGALTLTSPSGAGTILRAELPCAPS